MTLSLPVDPDRARSLTRVVPELSASLRGESSWWAPARSAVVFVVDGLGAVNLAERAGHARFLTARRTKKDVARTVFPSTTAAALTSLLTGTAPGEHGIVGYRVRASVADGALNQLRDWGSGPMDPRTWQRRTPLLQAHADAGAPAFVVTEPTYARTGFTEAILRGGDFVGVADLTERVETAAALADRHPGALVYLYAGALDQTGHRHGSDSDEWAGVLEQIDDAARRLDAALGATTGAVVTADHGMVDVPAHRHVLLHDGDGLTDGVVLVAGEPRMLHLYAEPGEADDVAERWRRAEGHRSWVLTRAETTDAGLFGPVDPEVADRIGDVLVLARAGIAYYDDRIADKKPQNMVGQHGSLTDRERIVPLIRLGAYAG